MCTGGGQLGTAAEGPLPGTVTLWVPSVLGGVKRGVSGPRVSCSFPHWPHSKSSKLEEQEGSSATWQRDLMRGGWRRVGTGLGVDGASLVAQWLRLPLLVGSLVGDLRSLRCPL